MTDKPTSVIDLTHRANVCLIDNRWRIIVHFPLAVRVLDNTYLSFDAAWREIGKLGYNHK